MSSSASWARSAVLWISETIPASGWLWIRMERRTSKGLEVAPAEVAMPLAEKATIKGLTQFPAVLW